MTHPDVQLMIAHDIQRQRTEAAARYRLARSVRADRERRGWHRPWTRAARHPGGRHGLGTPAVQLGPC
jgi:hypothetical protein